MAQSLFKLLKKRVPERPIDVVAPAWSLPVLARMPEVRQGHALDVGHGELGLAKRRDLGLQLRSQYGQAIVLPRSLKAALVPWFANIPKRTGYRGELRFGVINDVRPFDRVKLDQTVKRFAALGLEPEELMPTSLPLPELLVDSAAQRAAKQAFDVNESATLIGLMPGAEYGPAKCWPLAHFASLARSLTALGVTVLVFGGPSDQQAGQEIVDQSGGAAKSLCGRTSLTQAIDLLAACQQVVSNDSGLMHVAAAVGARVVALYGSTTPAFTPPLTTNAAILDLQLECSPCFKRECPLGHLKCLNDITPSAVLSAMALVPK